jgi:hypothetical protein
MFSELAYQGEQARTTEYPHVKGPSTHRGQRPFPLQAKRPGGERSSGHRRRMTVRCVGAAVKPFAEDALNVDDQSATSSSGNAMMSRSLGNLDLTSRHRR